MGRRVARAVTVVATFLGLAEGARAATIRVGPGQTFSELSEVVDTLNPGDVVELEGDHTYGPVELYRSGSASAPITVRGISVNGRRPVIAGGEHTVYFEGAEHWTFENVEITGGSLTCVLHRGAYTIFRNSVIHDCERHGILGTDDNSGSLLLEYVEVYEAGSEPAGENLKHPIYIATDSSAYPDAVFKMQYCYVHDSNGGNSVKSRANRTELYYNWIEGAQYYEIELIGPDGDIPAVGPREDADVVGNVFVQSDRHTSGSYVSRIGSDGSGETAGRYRFVNNVFVADAAAEGPLRCNGGIESIELHNNVFVHLGGAPFVHSLRRDSCDWTQGEQIFGSNNWYPQGSDELPPDLMDTLQGGDAGFENLNGFDLRLTAGSPLVNKGTMMTSTGGSFAFPQPLMVPQFLPPVRAKMEPGGEISRQVVQSLDLGPFEFGQEIPDPGPGSDAGGGGGGDGAGGGANGDLVSSCGCRAGGATAAGQAWGLLAMVGVLAALRTGRRRTRRRSRG